MTFNLDWKKLGLDFHKFPVASNCFAERYVFVKRFVAINCAPVGSGAALCGPTKLLSSKLIIAPIPDTGQTGQTHCHWIKGKDRCMVSTNYIGHSLDTST